MALPVASALLRPLMGVVGIERMRPQPSDTARVGAVRAHVGAQTSPRCRAIGISAHVI
jgi:hypothetical protein